MKLKYQSINMKTEMEYKTGIYDMSDREYRAIPNMLNASSIPYLLQSPSHYIANLTKPRSPTKEMSFGTGLHTYVLEPERFKNEFLVKSIDGRTVAGKKFLLENELIHKKIIISEEDFERIRYMDSNIKKHPIASTMLVDGHAEQVILFKLRASNGNEINCKAKVDYIINGAIPDLKSTKDASHAGFSKSIENYNYHIQGSFYSHAIESLNQPRPLFYFIAVESEPPFSVNVIELSEEHYTIGYAKIYEAVDIYEKCVRENAWPSYDPRIYKSRMSKWLK